MPKNNTKKNYGIVKLKIALEHLQKSLQQGRKSHSFRHEHKEIGNTSFVPDDVKEGHFAVTAREGNEMKRFIVPLNFLRHPIFLALLEQAAEEYGFDHNGVLMIPCRPSEIERILGEQWLDVGHSSLGVNWGSSFSSMVQSFWFFL